MCFRFGVFLDVTSFQCSVIKTLLGFVISAIEERLSAVTELCSPNASCLSHVKGLLSQLPDLERGLCTIFHKKVSLIKHVPTSCQDCC